MNSISSWPHTGPSPAILARSEAFAEDLAQDSTFADTKPPRMRMISTTLLCAVPVLVALLGGVAAFIHTVG
jgi:hypothetical protein